MFREMEAIAKLPYDDFAQTVTKTHTDSPYAPKTDVVKTTVLAEVASSTRVFSSYAADN